MVATTREAGALTLEHFKRFRDLEIGVKGPGDFVSDADRESETLIRDRLLSRYPWGLTGEEFAPRRAATTKPIAGCVDPIDGTTNFIEWPALYDHHRPPPRQRDRVRPGLRSRRRRNVHRRKRAGRLPQRRAPPCQPLHRCRHDVRAPASPRQISHCIQALRRLDAIRAPIGAVRIVGSAANSCAWVACGRLTGYLKKPASSTRQPASCSSKKPAAWSPTGGAAARKPSKEPAS